MVTGLRRLLPAFLLIGIASAILLISDLERRQSLVVHGSVKQSAASTPMHEGHVQGGMANHADKENLRTRYNGPAKVAMINLINAKVLDQAEQGVEKGLQERGLIPGKEYILTKYNAQGDMSLLPQLIDSAVIDGADLLVTITTPVLMAAVKKRLDIPVVFSVASDPKNLDIFPKGRPANIYGVHDDPQLAALVDMVRAYNPDIRAIGTIYNPAQRNGVISVEYVFESSEMDKGAVIGLVRDYFDSGVEAGAKAVRVLHGEHPGDIPFTNTRSEKLFLNEKLARSLNLHLSQQLLGTATRVVTDE